MSQQTEDVGSKSPTRKKKARPPSPPRRYLRDSKVANIDNNVGKFGKDSPTNKSKKGDSKQVRFRGAGKPSSSKRSKSMKGTNDNVLLPKENDVVDEDVQMEDDPVMALFETRNTNRVRFSLEEVDDKKEKKRHRSPERPGGPPSGNFNIKAFMRRTLFVGNKKNSSNRSLEAETRQDPEGSKPPESPPKALTRPTMVWESAETGDSPEVIHTQASPKTSGSERLTVSFVENKKTRAEVTRLLSKAKRAEHKHYNYGYAIKCYVNALDLLTAAHYPDDHPAVFKTLAMLNHAHHAESSFKNSANIVKMGLRNEESGELVKALKMYTIAYRIRRDNLSRSHPSLVVLLNMLGSIQIKRGELKEAMQIYELALKDTVNPGDEEGVEQALSGNPLARSVTYRDMGTIYERWGEETKALDMYQRSLECASAWRSARKGQSSKSTSSTEESKSSQQQGGENGEAGASVQVTKSSHAFTENGDQEKPSEAGEMEVFLSTPDQSGGVSGDTSMTRLYNSFFPLDGGSKRHSRKNHSVRSAAAEERDSFADVDVALTLHQIGQLYRKQGQYSMALDAYGASLRGMKHALGSHHPNVAAILGNIGNLHKEKGDMDSAYEKYQEVLKLESNRLGLSHPEVAITLHNIGTIEAARGNYDQALSIYRKVLALQRRLLGEDHISVAATTSCMGDVHQKLGDIEKAMEFGEEALKIKMNALGKHTIEVARMLHKLGKMSFEQKLYNLAESYITRALLIYKLNKVEETHEWIVDANRDGADIEGALALGAGRFFEC